MRLAMLPTKRQQHGSAQAKPAAHIHPLTLARSGDALAPAPPPLLLPCCCAAASARTSAGMARQAESCSTSAPAATERSVWRPSCQFAMVCIRERRSAAWRRSCGTGAGRRKHKSCTTAHAQLPDVGAASQQPPLRRHRIAHLHQRAHHVLHVPHPPAVRQARNVEVERVKHGVPCRRRAARRWLAGAAGLRGLHFQGAGLQLQHAQQLRAQQQGAHVLQEQHALLRNAPDRG